MNKMTRPGNIILNEKKIKLTGSTLNCGIDISNNHIPNSHKKLTIIFTIEH